MNDMAFPENPHQHLLSLLPVPTSALAIEPSVARPTTLRNRSAIIRPFLPEDVKPMYMAARESMGQLCSWMTWCGPDYSLSDAEAFVSQSAEAWEKGERYSFAIIDAKNNTFAGSIGLNHLDFGHRLGNVGYWVRSSATRGGLATAATGLIALYAQQLGLNRLEFVIPLANIASQRVAQKAGAKFEGIMQSRLMISGKCHDARMYSLLTEHAARTLTVLDRSFPDEVR